MIICVKGRNKGEDESKRLKARQMERGGLCATCGQAVSRCQCMTGGVRTVITLQICLIPLECHSRRIRPASLTWSGGDRERHQHKLGTNTWY